MLQMLLLWVGVLDALGVVTLAASVVVQWRTASRIRPYDELYTGLRETQLQLSDLADHVERKETRERVRKMRDGRAAAAAAEQPPGAELQLPLTDDATLARAQLKAALRRKAAVVKLNGHG